jgi:hypothetical protein
VKSIERAPRRGMVFVSTAKVIYAFVGEPARAIRAWLPSAKYIVVCSFVVQLLGGLRRNSNVGGVAGIRAMTPRPRIRVCVRTPRRVVVSRRAPNVVSAFVVKLWKTRRSRFPLAPILDNIVTSVGSTAVYAIAPLVGTHFLSVRMLVMMLAPRLIVIY